MRKFIIYLFFFLVFLFSIFVSGIVESQDGLQYLAVARNIYYGKGPTAPPYEYNIRKNIHMTTYVGKDGKTYSFTGLGFSLAMVPAAALTDFVYRQYNVTPAVHFPLESDWLIFLTASFTNVFFASLLGVTFFLFFTDLKLTKRQALAMTFISLFTTNLFVYAKHLMPHMMFVSFIFLSFYLLKRFSRTKKRLFLVLSGLSCGIVMITYNQTYMLAAVPYIVYYLALFGLKFSFKTFKSHLFNAFSFLLGLAPFFYVYTWFEHLRGAAEFNNSPTFLASNFTNYILGHTQIPVVFEGFYGQLLSPGRSFFIYSPIVIAVIIFWFKIQKKILPELLLFLSYSAILIGFYSFTVLISAVGQDVQSLWHGESSWGPRYITPLIPLAMLVVAHIYSRVSRKVKLLFFLPLCIAGLYVEFLGVLMPYQIKFHELDTQFFVNNTNYNVFVYSNLLPRYSPIIMMSKKLVKLTKLFPLSYNYGRYNTRFFDGISFPFNVGLERWRSVEGEAYISFDNDTPSVNKITLDLINHPISETKVPAKMTFALNGKELLKTPLILKITERKTIDLSINESHLKPKGNILTINVDYGKAPIVKDNKQILGLIGMFINELPQNMESISVPNVSPLGPKLTGAVYRNWGGTNTDPWKPWDIHTQTFERLPDFWWVRNLFYWDVPKLWILGLFGINLAGLAFFTIKLRSAYKKLKD